MKTTQRFVVSAMAAAVLLALGGCGEMSTGGRDAAIDPAPAPAPARSIAQGAPPQCENANYANMKGIFTVTSPAPNAVNQQCLLTVYPASASSAQYPASALVEGKYVIELSGGGGGGAGGAAKDGGGGGGGAGAAPFRTTQYLSPGVYKLTIGTGGEGGKPGGWTQFGNPTSLTKADTGQLIAGFPGADVWSQRNQAPGSGRGGAASAGGSSGGSGGDAGSNSESRSRTEAPAQSGGMLQTPGYSGQPGQAGSETGRTGETDAGRGVAQADAGGGGGAGVGSGGAGESAGSNSAAGIGNLGGGGGGGSGAANRADAGSRGGHGFIRLTMAEPARQAVAPAPAAVAKAPAPAAATIATPAPAAMRPARKDRN